MRSWKRSATTIETHEVWIIRNPPQTMLSFCFECGVEAQMLKPEEAARLARVSQRIIYRWVEEGRMHFTETPAEGLCICLNSLPT
jgi:excisionase family DNA binding protein